MPAWMMLALQSVAGPPSPAKPIPVERPCPAAQPGEEIVVCARPDDQFRLKLLPDRFTAERTPPKAETAIGGLGNVAVKANRGADA
ncbi:5'-nucleotidase [Sphingomonas mucosissima]|uniref:5'-nucleotidase n=1 Tax=Sphingomonas mucosissima TaxID=370959 RepID=UPI001124F34F|nr:5'-nucleotidase [Sphingomonas mucosissima]